MWEIILLPLEDENITRQEPSKYDTSTTRTNSDHSENQNTNRESKDTTTKATIIPKNQTKNAYKGKGIFKIKHIYWSFHDTF